MVENPESEADMASNDGNSGYAPSITHQDQSNKQTARTQQVLSPDFGKPSNPKSNTNNNRLSPRSNSRLNEHRGSISTEYSNIARAEELKAKMKQEQEISLAITLVIIALLFICCQSVKLITDIYEMIYCDRPSIRVNSEFEEGTHFILDFLLPL